MGHLMEDIQIIGPAGALPQTPEVPSRPAASAREVRMRAELAISEVESILRDQRMRHACDGTTSCQCWDCLEWKSNGGGFY